MQRMKSGETCCCHAALMQTPYNFVRHCYYSRLQEKSKRRARFCFAKIFTNFDIPLIII